MCGRYAAASSLTELVEGFEVDEVTGEVPGPRWNVAPTDPVAIVTPRKDEPGRGLRVVRWGLVPSWSKTFDSGRRGPLINARAETVTEKPSFRKAFAARRCVVPMDGYYEWRSAVADGKAVRQPWYLHRRDGAVIAAAGIYEWWRDDTKADGDPTAWLASCAVLTTEAADDIGQLHDRMPVLLESDQLTTWLVAEPPEAELLLQERVRALAGVLTAWPVSRRVNRVGEEGPELIEGIPAGNG